MSGDHTAHPHPLTTKGRAPRCRCCCARTVRQCRCVRRGVARHLPDLTHPHRHLLSCCPSQHLGTPTAVQCAGCRPLSALSLVLPGADASVGVPIPPPWHQGLKILPRKNFRFFLFFFSKKFRAPADDFFSNSQFCPSIKKHYRNNSYRDFIGEIISIVLFIEGQNWELKFFFQKLFKNFFRGLVKKIFELWRKIFYALLGTPRTGFQV